MRKLEQIRPRLFRLAYSWNHQRELADDLVQDTLAKALKNENQLSDLKGFDSWVFKILINNWRNHLSRTRVMENIDDFVLSEEHSPESLHEQQWIIASVQEAVATLPQGQRQILMLVDLEGLSYMEVASIFEIPIGTVMSRICRARKKLAKMLLNIQQQSAGSHQMLRRVK
jgi:RNA polymerase sigma-70 factor (ECF subfamily)